MAARTGVTSEKGSVPVVDGQTQITRAASSKNLCASSVANGGTPRNSAPKPDSHASMMGKRRGRRGELHIAASV